MNRRDDEMMAGAESNVGELNAPVPETRHSLWKPIALGLLLITFMVLARVLHVGDRLGEMREWILSLGAYLLFSRVYQKPVTTER